MWNGIVLGTLVVAALLVVAYVIANLRPGALPNEQVIPDEGQGEVPVGTPLTFQNDPPSSGTHFEQPAPWGLAEAVVEPGYYLNNLARGGIVILYQCATDCAAEQAQFADLLKRAPKDTQYNQVKVLITRYSQPLPAPVVALAWGHQLNLAAYDASTLLTWYKRFVNYGPNNGP